MRGFSRVILLSILTFAVPVCGEAKGKENGNSLDTNKVEAAAKKEGFKLDTFLTVKDNVAVDAVLLPPKVVQQLFGKEVSKTYAVVHLTVSNRSPEAALIVHSIFIDFSRWLLANIDDRTSEESTDDVAWRAYSEKYHVSSVESRIVRGQMLQAQPWTVRNITVRALRLLGALAAAYQFKIHDQDWIRGIAAFNGNLIPGVETFWPDSTVDRISRLADLGFHVNTIVPKESSSILMAFFPMDRFISPGLKKIFLKSPAVFFTPMSFIFDKQMKDTLGVVFSQIGGFQTKLNTLQERCLQYAAEGKELSKEDQLLKKFLDRLSMDSVRIVVGGTMTVDVGEVPASIADVIAEGGNDLAATWAEAGEKTATISGRCFSGGKPLIPEAEKLGISDLAIVAGSLSDRHMQIKFKLNKRVDPDSEIKVQVIKERKDKPTIESMVFPWRVSYTLTPLGISNRPTIEGDSIVIKGAGFFNTSDHPLIVELLNEKGEPLNVKAERVTREKYDKITIDTKNLDGFAKGKWMVRISRGKESQDSERFEKQ